MVLSRMSETRNVLGVVGSKNETDVHDHQTVLFYRYKSEIKFQFINIGLIIINLQLIVFIRLYVKLIQASK